MARLRVPEGGTPVVRATSPRSLASHSNRVITSIIIIIILNDNSNNIDEDETP